MARTQAQSPTQEDGMATMETSAAAALARAQGQMGKAFKNAANPHHKNKYADLASVLGACGEALHDNGFSVLQPIGRDEIGPYVDTVLLHASGERFECRVHLILPKQDMQGLGSAITYARRYGLMAMAAVAPADGTDDDGEAASRPPQRREEPRPLVEQMGPQPAPQQPAPPIPLPKVRAGVLKKIAAAPDLAELERMGDSEMFKGYLRRFQAEDPAIWAEVNTAFVERREALRPPMPDDEIPDFDAPRYPMPPGLEPFDEDQPGLEGVL